MSGNALSLVGVSAGYDRSTVLHDVNLTIPRGGAVALLGPNGAGKTTLLRVASGLLLPMAGSIELSGNDVTDLPPHKRRQAGLCLVPEGRGVFPNLTVRENLVVQVPRADRKAALDRVLNIFPDLSRKLGQLAGSMSGGQQQMLALARCHLRSSEVVLVDEASMGLAPLVVDEVYDALNAMRKEGCALLVVEQFVDRALALADVVYALGHGTTECLGAPDKIDREELMNRYLGGSEPSSTSTSRQSSPNNTSRNLQDVIAHHKGVQE